MVAAVTGTVYQLGAVVITQYPAVKGAVTNLGLVSVSESSPDGYTHQLQTIVVVNGRVDNHLVKVWTFSLDGHDFYIVTLGTDSTLVYDLTTKEWSEWNTEGLAFWRARKGLDWSGMGMTTYANAQSYVVAGDDTYGLLWTLNPEVGYDEDPIDASEVSFSRKVIGGLPMRLRETKPVGAVYLTGSVGAPQLTGANITLRTSDDSGKSWTNHGTITVTPSNYEEEFVWRSLGLIKAPGKLFEITDNGATVRIDGLDMR